MKSVENGYNGGAIGRLTIDSYLDVGHDYRNEVCVSSNLIESNDGGNNCQLVTVGEEERSGGFIDGKDRAWWGGRREAK